MKNKKIIVGIVLLIAVLLLGVAYAAVSNITLKITGSASATADAEFKVQFAETPGTVTSNESNAAVTIARSTETDKEHEATFSVSGLTTKGQTVVMTYTIENVSPALAANLNAPAIENASNDWFKITVGELSKTTLTAKSGTTADAATFTVTVEMLKTPITEQEAEDATLNNVIITLLAEPQRPTE